MPALILAVIGPLISGVVSFFSKGIDLVMQLFNILARFLGRYLLQITHILYLTIIWTFFLYGITTICIFTLYHLNVGLYVFLSRFCTQFTVELIQKSFIGIIVFSIGYFFKSFLPK